MDFPGGGPLFAQGQKGGRSRLDTALHKFYLDFVVFEAGNS